MGRALTVSLAQRGHKVRALVRPGSGHRADPAAEVRELDLFNVDELAAGIQGSQDRRASGGYLAPESEQGARVPEGGPGISQSGVAAAKRAEVSHFVYVSVAQPAPVMKAYLSARAQAERALSESGLIATVIRPWYVLGPGHRWPILLVPIYACAELIPSLRAGAQRLGLVTLRQMTAALVEAVEQPPATGTTRLVEVPRIKQCR